MSDLNAFRPKKNVSQIYINIPGCGRFHVEADRSDPEAINLALEAAWIAFWDEYERSRNSWEHVIGRRMV